MNLRIIVFFVLGLLIFLLDITLNSQEDSKDIYISDQELTSLLGAWQSQVGRPPSDEEIVNIINNFVKEEILYREALLLGLDQEDRIIKRFIQREATGDIYPPEFPVEQHKLNPRLIKIGKGIKASSSEQQENVRARSAVLRIAEKLELRCNSYAN